MKKIKGGDSIEMSVDPCPAGRAVVYYSKSSESVNSNKKRGTGLGEGARRIPG